MTNKKYFFKLISSIYLLLIVSVSPALSQDGPHNLGFEDGESSWTRISEAASITVVGIESADSYPVYADYDIAEVRPDADSGKMLRLASPKMKSEKMNLGDNTVSQTFNSFTDSLVLSFRLFSFEHRDRDTFSINVTQTSDSSKQFTLQDRNGGDFSVVMYEGQPAQSCSLTPCTLKLTSGKSGSLINTGWKQIIISGLPTDGSEVTLTYSLDGVNDNAHPSWAYVDSWNHNPVANFSVSRESTIEGNVSKFADTSTDVDPEDAISRREWEITYNNAAGGSETVTRLNAKQISVIASNQGTATVKLKVYDRFGGHDTVASGDTRSALTVPSVTYTDSPIFVNNLNSYNVVAGSKGNILTARYAKPGWDDDVTATWTIANGGGSLVQSGAENTKYSVPMMLKGVASIPFDAPEITGTSTISLVLADPIGGQSVSKEITINVLPTSQFSLSKDGDAKDGNDSPSNSTKIVSGTVTAAHLDRINDVDFYKITDANGNNFPVGSEVFVRLRNITTDHDLFIVAPNEVAPDSTITDLKGALDERDRLTTHLLANRLTTHLLANRLTTHLLANRLDSSEDLNENVMVAFSPSWDAAVQDSTLHSFWLRDTALDPFTSLSIGKGFDFEQLPLSESLFLPQKGTSNVGEKDIVKAETAIKKALGTGYQITSFSANDGYDDEVVLLKVMSDGDLYLAVASDGEFGSPYSLQLEHSTQANLEHITDGACNGEQLVENGSSDSSGIIADANFGNEVMYVVNPQRMIAKYGQSRWDTAYGKLKSLAELASGKILAVDELTAYLDMDLNPCQVDKTNVVASAIRDLIGTNRSGTDSVILVGDDSILPFYRAVDPTNFIERDYASQTPINVSSPMYAALFNSHILTDKFYASDYPLSDLSEKILIPVWGVSRLVETPEEIESSINEHINNEYSVNMVTAMVSAYDTVLDSGIDIASILETGLTDGGFDNVTEIPFNFDLSDPWYAANIKCHMLGDIDIVGCKAKDIASLNGHFSHNTLISQASYELGINDNVTTHDINETTIDRISGNYIYTPGCHAGLNIPAPTNSAYNSSDVGDRVYGDFPQSYINKGITYLAGTGYGIAGVNTNSYSEKLMGWHTKTLIRGGKAGIVAADADAYFLQEAIYNGLSAYDLKAMYQSTLYGFANATLLPGADIPLEQSSGVCSTSNSSQSFSLTVLDGDVQNNLGSVSMSKVCTTSGDYYEVEGSTLSVAERPVQPMAGFKFASSEGEIHGILIEQASYTDEQINPTFLTATTDNDGDPTEVSFCHDGRYWPPKAVELADDGVNTYLQFVSGQFICTDNNESTGTQRLYTDATVKVLRSTSTDTTPPVILSVEPKINDLGLVVYSVDATDVSGINHIVLTISLGDSIKIITSDPLSGDGPFVLELNQEDSELALNNDTTVTVIDGANNLTVSSAKGRGINHVIVKVAEDIMFSSLSPKTLTSVISDYSVRKAAASSMSYVWDFGDGYYESGSIFDGDVLHPRLVVDEVNDVATLTTEHLYSSDINADVKFKVTDAAGGIGSDNLALRYCADPAEYSSVNPDGDLVLCDTTFNGTQVKLTVKVAEGGVISPDYQYRLYMDYDNDGTNDLKLIYDNGSVTKTKKVGNLIATATGSVLEFTFDLAPTGWVSGNAFNWYMETQSGVEKGKAIGSADAMPDSGYFSY